MTLPPPEVLPDVPVVDATAAALARAKAGELLGPQDMMAIFKLSPASYYRRKARGEFNHLMVKPAVGPHCFSGVLVHRYVSGEPVYEPTFGRRRQGSR